MSIRIATFNVNNLFQRASLFQLTGFSAEADAVLKDVQQLEELLAQPSYASVTGTQILDLIQKHLFNANLNEIRNPWFFINVMRGPLYIVTGNPKHLVLKAHGPADWVGFIELRRDTVDERSTQNTGRVIQTVNADVVCVVEVESRITLSRFNDLILEPLHAAYPHNLLIDGNDERGIDVGLLSRFPIPAVWTHIDDPDPQTGERLFSRDCPEYEIVLPSGKPLWMLCNHLKSKAGAGTQGEKAARRKRQADRVVQLLGAYDLTSDFVIVAGDMNDTPDSAPLSGLLATANLFDILASPLLAGSRGTYRRTQEQIDYLLVSKPLADRLQSVAIERRGIVGAGSFPEVIDEATQASDHACVFADFDL